MDLSNLKAPKGANRPKKRVGRGHGSTLGKTAGRGQKGQKSRSGGSVRPGFEGGQTPLHRRIPKRGFTNIFAKQFAIVNLADLDRVFADGDKVDMQSLADKGLIRGKMDGVKILGNGTLSKKLSVEAHKFSKSALEKIQGAGGSVEVIERD